MVNAGKMRKLNGQTKALGKINHLGAENLNGEQNLKL